jgi:hypothetical protein
MSRYFWPELGSILYRVTLQIFRFQMSYKTLPKVKSPNDFYTKKQPEKLTLKNPQEKLLQARNKKSSNRHKIAPQKHRAKENIKLVQKEQKNSQINLSIQLLFFISIVFG